MGIKKIVLEKANRLYQLPPELMTFIPREQRVRLLRRAEVVDLASFVWPVRFGEHDLTSPASLVPADSLKIAELKEELAAWLQRQHGGHFNAEHEIFVGGSITSLIFALCLAYVDHGDLAFAPDLGIPTYRRGIIAAGGEPVTYPITAKTNWQPDFERLGTSLGRVARLLFLNTPHNPTGSELNQQDMDDLVWRASREHLLVVNDAAYQAIPDRPPVSLLSAAGGKKVGVELYSFAYQFGLPHLPFGFVAGNREVIAALKQTKRLMPVAIPSGYVDLIMEAIRKFPTPRLKEVRQDVAQAADAADRLLRTLQLTRAGFRTVPFLWVRSESRRQSVALARQFFRRYRLLTVPGSDFGESGEGYLRLSLTPGKQGYVDADERLRKRRLSLKKKEAES